MNAISAMNNSLPKSFQIFSCYTFKISVGNDRRRVVTNHTSAVTRARPFGEETAFFISISKTFLHLFIHRRINEVEQGEEATESIPETGVGKHISGENLTIVGAIVDRIAILVEFIERAGEEHRAIKTRIESAELVDVVVFNFDTAKSLIPNITTGVFYLLKVVIAELFEVKISLVIANERRRYTRVNLFAARSLKANDSAGVVTSCRCCRFVDIAIANRRNVRERFVEFDYEIVAEIFGNTAVVFGCVADNFVFTRNNGNRRAIIESVNNNIGVVAFRESKS